ncbi:MAG: sulfite exporter TauE/SafE family protein [Hydrogenobaculum sp.]|nr:MAG: sulfite exporter TauE/SafE family protein [Hydrogenobaculum sp.]
MIFASWVVQGISGFGGGVFMVTLLSLVMNIKSAVLTFSFIQALGPLSILLVSKSYKPNMRMIFYLITGSFVGIFLGAHILKIISATYMEMFSGLFFISIGIFDSLFIFKNELLDLTSKIEIKHGFFVGVVSGVFSGIVGIGGPPAAIYLRNIVKEFDEYRYLISIYFVLMVGIRLFIYYILHAFSNVRYEYIAYWGVASVMGLWTGRFISRFINKRYLNLSVPFLTIICGILLIAKGLKSF